MGNNNYSIPEQTWWELLERDEGQCISCLSDTNLMPCHYKSKGSGGSDELDNLWLGCFNCHRMSHDGKLEVRRIGGRFYFQRVR